MGMFKKKVKVSNSKKPKQFFEEEFWVDTGALYSFVPEDYLLRIGVDIFPGWAHVFISQEKGFFEKNGNA